MILTDAIRSELVEAARAAVTKAFLTSPGGTAYGAAVFTRSGAIYSAGQYSSWNHVTNVHAEQAALVIATMADDPDVLALALSSTSKEEVVSSCGCCRQVMSEHAARTGRDFELLLAHRFDSGFERTTVSALLPLAWVPASRTKMAATEAVRQGILGPLLPVHDRVLAIGDHLILTDGSLAMVWDPEFMPGKALVKIKYEQTDDNTWRKVVSSFSDAVGYQKWLCDRDWIFPTPFGLQAAVIGLDKIAGLLPLRNFDETGTPPGPLLSILAEGGVNTDLIRVSGSRATGLKQPDSDWDLIVPVSPSTLATARKRIFRALREGEVSLPERSGTWKLLDKYYPGGRQAILEQGRFIDTVETAGTAVALIFVPLSTSAPVWDPGWTARGRGALHGVIRDASSASFKRAEAIMTLDTGAVVEIISFHKAANLLQTGDRVSLRGWMLQQGNRMRLIQHLVEPDGIRWF